MSNIFNIYLCSFIIYVTVQYVTAKPADEVSYLETNINIEHDNDQWICGNVECPEKTYGCKIALHSDKENMKVLHQSFSCFDEEKVPLLGAEDIIEMSKQKVIKIELESYEGAVSLYSTGYGMGGHENARGVVAVEDLNALKESAKKNREAVSNPP
ncbi:uncharacterized protein LOC119606302 [Lucilia sericata]|uniref:uncharacterized protein LOC119606302 n=1 Tax=Lucilia sericata TaxID=13632 RepID=UPI0018A80F6B|nr:uncharacterized protein LOC119606302 [Lucilia sericata]